MQKSQHHRNPSEGNASRRSNAGTREVNQDEKTTSYKTNGIGDNDVLEDDVSDFDDIACCLCKCAVDFGDASFFLPPPPTRSETELVGEAVAYGTVKEEDAIGADDVPLKEIKATFCAREAELDASEEKDSPIISSDGVAATDDLSNLKDESETKVNGIESSEGFDEKKETEPIVGAELERNMLREGPQVAEDDDVLVPSAVLPTATPPVVNRDEVSRGCNECNVKKVFVATEVGSFELSDEKKQTDHFVESRAERKMPQDGHRVAFNGTVSSSTKLTEKCSRTQDEKRGRQGPEVILTPGTPSLDVSDEKKETDHSEDTAAEMKMPLSGLETYDDCFGARVSTTDHQTVSAPKIFDRKGESNDYERDITVVDAIQTPKVDEVSKISNGNLNQIKSAPALSSLGIELLTSAKENSPKGDSIKQVSIVENIGEKKGDDIDNQEVSSHASPRFQLPQRFHDPDNALILCDGPAHASKRRNSKGDAYICERAYHQRCHFIPVFSIPRGPWRCLICRYRDEEFLRKKVSSKGRKGHSQNKGAKGKGQQLDGSPREMLTDEELNAIFRCPPQLLINANEVASKSIDVVSMELKFERVSAPLKAKILHAELTTRAKAFINKTLSNIRVAEHSIRAFTESSKARKLLSERMETMDGRLPQELAQCVYKIAYAKKRIRDFIMSIRETIKRRSLHGRMARGHYGENIDCVDVTNELMQWYLSHGKREQSEQSGDSGGTDLLKFLFPEGHTRRRRVEPRTAEANTASNASASHASDSSGVSLDDLKCTCCNEGHASHENDLLLCDGENCYRAFHMHCLEPKLTPEELASDENDNWFCPLCSAHAMLVHWTQREYLGDEWDEHMKPKSSKEDPIGDDSQSLREWESADDVFPEASSELRVAQKLKDGVKDSETEQFLSETFGIIASSNHQLLNGASLEDEDEEEENDEDFVVGVKENVSSDGDSSVDDMDEERNLLKERIDADELDALSVGSTGELSYGEGSYDDSIENRKPRRSKRQRSLLTSENVSDFASDDESSAPDRDGGKLDTANIIQGKRNRTKVDYRKLNDALFGDESDDDAKGAASKLEYKPKAKPPKRGRSVTNNEQSGSGSEN